MGVCSRDQYLRGEACLPCARMFKAEQAAGEREEARKFRAEHEAGTGKETRRFRLWRRSVGIGRPKR